MPPNVVNFGPQTAENGWRVFAHLLKFARGTSVELQAHICDPFPFNHIRQMAPMVDADAKSLVSRWRGCAPDGLTLALPCI